MLYTLPFLAGSTTNDTCSNIMTGYFHWIAQKLVIVTQFCNSPFLYVSMSSVR